MSFADFGKAAAEEEEEEEEESEWEEVSEEGDEDEDGDGEADDILSPLVDLFKAQNGRNPSEEEMAQWVQTLKEAL